MGERDAYLERLKAEFDEWNAELDKLEAKATQATADAKIEYESQIKALRKQRDDVSAKIDEIQGAGEDAWTRLKEGLDNAWSDLKTALEKATASFR